MKTSHETDKILPALAAVTREIPEIPKRRTANADKFSYSYADISDILDIVKPVLISHGLIITQDVGGNGSGITITTRIWHSTSGQWIEGEPLPMYGAGKSAQALGSLITYGRRYDLSPLLALATEDDDDGAVAEAPRTTPKSAQAEATKTTFAGEVLSSPESHESKKGSTYWTFEVRRADDPDQKEKIICFSNHTIEVAEGLQPGDRVRIEDAEYGERFDNWKPEAISIDYDDDDLPF